MQDVMLTLRYARRCFLAPRIHGRSFVLSCSAVTSKAESSEEGDTDDPDGSERIMWSRVEKWDRTSRFSD
jgi:hypothetical protein